MAKFARIAVSLPMDRLFDYSIPENISEAVTPGKRVFVPFGGRTMVGYVVGLSGDAEINNAKSIISVIDKTPLLSDEMLKLTEWMKETYFCSWGEAISAVIPAGIKRGREAIGLRIKEAEPVLEKIESVSPHDLTAEQSEALKSVIGSIDKGEYRTYLLHGITSSGKTEVYLQAISHVLKTGAQAIVLVPEISLTPQTIERFKERFGGHVAVIHSRLTAAKKFLEWKRIREGSASIVVGARSAIFAPVKKLGLIIIDEEHETSYKQDDVPRYHARDVAVERAKLNNCPLILGTATPSVEAYHRAQNGEYALISLTKRVEERLLPKVKIVDMRMELATRRRVTVFSKVMLDAIQKTLINGKQAMIFLNRRGFSTFINCKKCGLVVKCKRCDAVLVYHFETKKMICHYCGYAINPPDICPGCKSEYIKYLGLGTEKVESEISRSFPGAKIVRMDSDTTIKRGSHDRILGDFRSGKADILVGTQMIAKGHDFPQVTLVCVVSADVSLNIPDFRSGERTFNLLTQVAGRSGRGKDTGDVIIQTYVPDHYAILAAAKHDYDRFYNDEIKYRKELLFPPFINLTKITVRARNEDLALKTAQSLVESIKREDPLMLVSGPSPAPMVRMRGYYRYNLLLKSKERAAVTSLLRKALGGFRKPGGVLIAVDVDPVSM